MSKKMYFEQPCRLTKRSRSDANDGTWSHFGLPLGNGRIGAVLGGEVFQEVIQLNEESLINGGPLPNQTYHHGNAQNRSQDLKEIQSLLLANQNAAATELCQKRLVGLAEGYGAYQNLGEIVIGYQFSETAVTNYHRELDLEKAIHAATFNVGQNKIKRQTFISAVDQLFVHHFSSQEAIQLLFAFQSEHPHHVEQTENGWQIKGYLSDNYLQFTLELSLIFDEGELEISNEMLILKNCSEVTLIVGMVTDYAAVFPKYRRELPLDVLNQQISKGIELGFNELKNRHLLDYQALFKRVDFQLFANDDILPVNQIVAKGGQQLAELLYHFGRYLLISSSRAGNLPSNLQGVWNETNDPPWGSDYHLNVNLQMNYWGAAGANLVETLEPLVAYVEHLREPGRLTAAVYHGIVSDDENPSNGFIAHTQTTPFGFTGPGWDFEWGWSPAAIPWILENLYDVYLFTLDQTYLKQIYSMLKEATRFFEQALVYNQTDGYYYSAPAYSPEHGPITLGNVYEHSLIQQLILNTIEAAEILDCDRNQVLNWQMLAKKIRTEEIGADGQIKEWFEETTIGSVEKYEKNHRHVSHLLGLYPMHRIQKNKSLAQAAAISLEDRGLGTTGWSLIHRALMWARLGSGQMLEQILTLFLSKCLNENLFATHPPFQIDANLGYVALVQEALVQSQVGQVEILPALPTSWTNGKVKGIRCRGNLEVAFSWQASQLIDLTIETASRQAIQLLLPGKEKQTVVLDIGRNDLSTLID